MNCPNCNKSYHWCFSCGCEELGVACSYTCALDLYEQDKINDYDMLLWAQEYIYQLQKEIRELKNPPTTRVAKTTRTNK